MGYKVFDILISNLAMILSGFIVASYFRGTEQIHALFIGIALFILGAMLNIITHLDKGEK